MRFFCLIAFGLSFATYVAGCSDDPGPLGCVPGHIEECPCLGGTAGVQVCNEEGNAYGFCSCDLPPDNTDIISDTSSDEDTPSDDIVPSDDAVEDIGEEDQSDPPPTDVEEDITTEDIVIGPTMIGCDGETYELPNGYVDAILTPLDATLISDAVNPAAQEYTLSAITESGNEIPVDTALFHLTNPNLGIVSSAGLFTAAPGVGGETQVRAQWLGICVEAHLSVIATSHHVTGTADPDVIDLFPDPAPAPLGDETMQLLYPPHEAAWPSNLAPMTVQWRHTPVWAETTFRIDIETDFNQIHVYTTAIDAVFSTGAYTFQLPPEAWSQIWNMEGGSSPHTVRVVAINADASLSLVTEGHLVTFTGDAVGGAVYYWNNDMESGAADAGRIRMLAMDEIEPVTVDIDAGCHGCHGVSPDGAIVAATVQSAGFDAEGVAEGWSMGLFSTETGAQADWIHDDAESFLYLSYTLNPTFSKYYWTDTTRHMVVASGGGILDNTPGGIGGKNSGRRLYSVDLFNGIVTQLTGVDTPDDGWVDMYPALSSDGEFLIFMRTANPGLFGAVEESFLYRMPYNAGLGGDPVPLAGADDVDILQYYPSLTPDDAYVVYNRVDGSDKDDMECAEGIGPGKGGMESSYNNCLSEIWVVSTDGGDAVRLDRGSGPPGAGLTNSWPSVAPMENSDYYWVAFSSYQPYGVLLNNFATNAIPVLPKPLPSESAVPQLWIVAIDPNLIGTGEDPSFAPIWLPYQDQGGGNHIGQWSVRVEDE